jgi:microcystin-dependent protein
MATNPFLGQLSLVGFNFAPQGWALAAGQTLTLSQYTALFSLLGTTYGGNGTNNFMLPNLQAAVAVGNGQGTGLDLYPPGQTGGETTVTLQVAQTPNHSHPPTAEIGKRDPAASTPIGNCFGESTGGNLYSTGTSGPLIQLNPLAVSLYGGGGPHNNMMPFLGLTWIIAMQGVYPTRS